MILSIILTSDTEETVCGNPCTDIRSYGFLINILFLNLLLGETHRDAQKCMNGKCIPHAILTVFLYLYYLYMKWIGINYMIEKTHSVLNA